MHILDGFNQPGPDAGSCYRCGEKGHRATDEACKGKKAIVTRTRRNGSSERREKGAATAKAKARAKGKEKQKLKEAGVGKAIAVNYLAPTITKEMVTASSAKIVASLTMDQKGESASTRPWPSKALRRNKRKK